MSSKASPGVIAELAARYRDVPVILGHIGASEYVKLAVAVARQNESISLETSVVGWMPLLLERFAASAPAKSYQTFLPAWEKLPVVPLAAVQTMLNFASHPAAKATNQGVLSITQCCSSSVTPASWIDFTSKRPAESAPSFLRKAAARHFCAAHLDRSLPLYQHEGSGPLNCALPTGGLKL